MKADHVAGDFDTGLVRHAFEAGRPVFAQGTWLSEEMIELGVALAAEATFGIEERYEFYRMLPPGEASSPGG